MSRLLALGVGLFALVGCTVDGGGDWTWTDTASYDYGWDGPPTLDQDSFLRYDNGMWGYHVDGMYLPDGQDWGVAGLSSMTCQLYLSSVSTGTDEDVNYGDDSLEDGQGDGNDDNQGEDGVHVIVGAGGNAQIVGFPSGAIVDSVSVPGRIVSRFVGAEMLASLVTDDAGCHVDFTRIGFGGSIDASVPLDSSYCDHPAEADPLAVDGDGHVWVISPTRIGLVGDGAITEVETGGDVMVWDAAAGVMYVATRDQSTLTAVEANGAIRWRADLGAPIQDVDDRGPAREAVVTTQIDDGNTGVILVDGMTGEQVAETGVARDPGRVTVTGDGSRLVLHNRDQLDVFTIQDP